eukprot:c3185_g1_i1.p1 GENE.c3185_g1_i1~~c3185_g1_i1.p1  ORF type:complete len:411 (+),score=45.88 c3185_g1_i1:105-1235(+)
MSTNTLPGFALAQGITIPWPDDEIYVFIGIFLPLFSFLALYSMRYLVLEWRTRRRFHILVLQFLIVAMSSCRILHFVLGPYSTHALLGKWVAVPPGVVAMLNGIPVASLLGAYCVELAMLVQVGWAASLQLSKLARQVEAIRKAAYVCSIASLVVEVGADSLLFLGEERFQRIQEMITKWYCIGVACTISGVFFDFLMKLQKLAEQRRSLPSAQYGRDMRFQYTVTTSQNFLPVLERRPSVTRLVNRIREAMRLLPGRARTACVAVLLGCCGIVACSFSQVLYLHLSPARLSPTNFKVVQYFGRSMELLVGCAISNSVTVGQSRSTPVTGSTSNGRKRWDTPSTQLEAVTIQPQALPSLIDNISDCEFDPTCTYVI